jgi:hypothetical protein
MTLPMHLALVPDGVDVSASELSQVAAALSKQVQRDFQPIWEVDATVDGFARLEDVPTDYWLILLMTNVQGAAGYHQDDNGQPYAVVEFGDQWSMTASHECLEMLADPFGSRLRAGNLLDQAIQLGEDPKRVDYLVEVCDPSESGRFSYQVNGVQVSDFYTPNFFDPVKAAGTRYSFTGAIGGPRTVLEDGYISWKDPSGHWLQLRMFPDEFSTAIPHVLDLTDKTLFDQFKTRDGLRGASDRVTKQPSYQTGLSGSALVASRVRTNNAVEARAARAEQTRAQVAELVRASAKIPTEGSPDKRKP